MLGICPTIRDGEPCAECDTQILSALRKAHEDGRLAGLEIAAKLLCTGCNQGFPIHPDEAKAVHWHLRNDADVYCYSWAIRARAAGLRKERG